MAVREIDSPPLPLRLITLLAVSHASFAGARLVLTLQAVNLHASPFAVGLLMSLLMVVPMFIAVPIGRWADKVGFFMPTVWGFAMLTGAGILAALMPTMAVLCVTSVLVGSGYMLAHVAVNNAIGQATTPATRAKAFGTMALGFSISGLVGPMLSGFVIDRASHSVAFAVLALFPVAAALLLMFPHRVPQPVGDKAPAAEGEGAKGGVMDLLRHGPLRAVFIVSGIMSMGWDLFTFLMPLHGARNGMSATAIGVVIGAFGAGNIVVRLAVPWLVRVMDEWRLLCTALALTTVCYLVFPFFTSMQALLPLAFVLGLVLGCGQPMAMSLVHVTAPPSRTGEAVGVRSTITSLSQTVLPLLFGAMGTAVGMVPVFWTAAVVLGSGSAYAGRRRLEK